MLRHTVILVGWVEDGAAESFDCCSTNDVQNDVFQATTDVMIDRYYHSVATYHSTADNISLFTNNGTVRYKMAIFDRNSRRVAYQSCERHEDDR